MIAGYKLRVNGGGLVNQIYDAGYVGSYEVTGLTLGETYLFEVAAYDGDGQLSLWSAPVEQTLTEGFMLVNLAGDALINEAGQALIFI